MLMKRIDERVAALRLRHGNDAYYVGYRDGGINALQSLQAEEWSAEDIRAEIARLEGELSRMSGESILLWDGMDGGTDYAETPPGGALVEYRTGMIEQAWRRWYGSTEAAKAALVALQREHGGAVEKSGLQWCGPRDLRAWITRR